jgi:hypothetical protein
MTEAAIDERFSCYLAEFAAHGRRDADGGRRIRIVPLLWSSDAG